MKVIAVPVPMMVIFTSLRWLLRAPQLQPTNSNLIVTEAAMNEVCPKEVNKSGELNSPATQASPGDLPAPFTFMKKVNEDGKKELYFKQRSSSMDEINPNMKDGNTLDVLGGIPLTRPHSTASESQVESEQKKKILTKKPTQYKVWIGRTLLLLITLGSMYMVWAISVTSESENSWPWGYWYVFALLFDLALFQPVITFFKYLLFFAHIHKPWTGKFKTLARAIIGSDILTAVESKVNLANK